MDNKDLFMVFFERSPSTSSSKKRGYFPHKPNGFSGLVFPFSKKGNGLRYLAIPYWRLVSPFFSKGIPLLKKGFALR